ncbi:ABC transporter permease [cf. Phormidesmis sp. LEGE 11477]|uniref:ABC transporter permease n=1 Tax=cf. Phormidesmis sp. LEGE 11477 TaxID=1828680 RepID=UPI00187FFC03|nr:ABC transporter permease [cf. Phormidesmis sp. LEGE 11477]MBE9062527.1 ABC transporter permease [cf. Phormidesmis sp. LEGE 11477]
MAASQIPHSSDNRSPEDRPPEDRREPALDRRYLRPSVFWSIRQGFPGWLQVTLVAVSLAIPILIWASLSYGQFVDARFLPTPSAVIVRGFSMLLEGDLIVDIFASSARVIAGFSFAALVGIPVGLAMGTFYSMDSLLGGFVRTARYLPIAAFVPLIIIWAGIDEASKIIIIFLGIVFYNATMIADAVKFIPNETLNVAYTLGATRWDVVRRVILPATLPSILDTLRVNIAGAWNFLVLSELIAAENGLGFTIVRSQRYLQTDRAMFCILVICMIGLATDFAFKLLFRLWLPWADSKMS